MSTVLLVVVVAVALGFDFTNGFHDTANYVATWVGTRALSPRIAVLVSAAANLAGAFVTPFDRDDMYRLAGVLDDICDNIDDSAETIVGYGVRDVREQARAQAAVIHRCATKLCEAIGRLEGFKDSKRQLIELRELEDEGDRLARDAISELMRGGGDPMDVLRWKDIYEQLEEAVDACENAADVLEAILVKNR